MEPEVMNEKYQFFLDVSGSVGGSANYYDTVSQILTLYGPEIDTFYLWDTSIETVDKKGLEKLIQKKEGRGGTSPKVVARQIVNKNLKNIILITDGQVGDGDVR